MKDCSMERMFHVIKKNPEDVALVMLISRILVNYCEGQPWDEGLNEAQRRFMADREWEV